MTDHIQGKDKGIISWMVHNRITPNLLMFILMAGGLFMTTKIKREVFPSFELDIVTITMAYPGASPAEVEQGIVLAIEESVRTLEGIEELSATASEGFASVRLELETGVERQKLFQEVQQEIARIRTFPEDAEEPQVSLNSRRHQAMAIQLYGDTSEWALRDMAEQVRESLLQHPDITQIELRGVRNYEIHLEVPQEKLRAYGLTLQQIARTVADTAVEVPGGGVKTSGGEILIRMMERRDWAREFADIPIITTSGGTVVYLRDIAEIRDGFTDSNRSASYNGYPSVGLAVYRVGEQGPIEVSEAVRSTLADIEPSLPPGIEYAINWDSAKIYKQRLDLLLKNAFIGLLLVLVLLSLFLEFSLAFWVVMGITTAFLGALLFLPGMGASINMVSMFAFIIALGIVVDDAIVAGENIYEYRQRGMSHVQAAIQGARDVAMPITFAILTNIIAFMPMLFIPGFLGKIWLVIPMVVVTVFIISWVEALLILPSHLAHAETKPKTRLTRDLHERQLRFSQFFSSSVKKYYGTALRVCLNARYLTVASGFALLFVVLAYAASGRMGLVLMPKVESDRAVVTAVLPFGSPEERSLEVRDILLNSADEVVNNHGGDALSKGVFVVINENEVEVTIYLTDPDIRPIGTAEVIRLWRSQTGQIAGLQSLRFESDRGGPGRGAALTVELSHRDIDVLDKAGELLASRLLQFDYVSDVNDGFAPGKEQLDFTLKEEGRSLGLTSQGVARQVRHAFYGAEAIRQQRGRNEVKTMVRLPESQRVREYDIEQLFIRTPSGRDIPLMQIADVSRGRAYAEISRRDARRTINVTAEVEPRSEASRILNSVKEEILPELMRDYPGLTVSFEGRQADFRESLGSLLSSFIVAMVVIYVMLAIPLHSYVQPIIIIMAIPFGIIGAVFGHMLMGYSLSIISLMGIVALSGVMVNDSLVMLDYANRQRLNGSSPLAAISAAGIRRFRPILLTTLTTFGGLAPMIFETSRQARFMIPMAISLGYGILFATMLILIIVPCLYLIVDDVLRFFQTDETPESKSAEATA